MKKITLAVCVVLACCLLFGGCSLKGAATALINQNGGGDYSGNESLTGYSIGDTEITEPVKNLDVRWASGQVDVVYHKGSSILLTEETGIELSDAQRMHWKLDGDTLRVRFSEGSVFSLSGNAKKHLTLSLPENFRGENIYLSAASAEIRTDVLRADKLEVESASGNLTLGAENVPTLSVHTASGKIDLKQTGETQNLSLNAASGDIMAVLDSAEKLDAEAASGMITLSANALTGIAASTASGAISLTVREHMEKCGISTASGEVTVKLPDALGFTAVVDTASGDFESDIALKHMGDCYIAGDGSAAVEIETSSGNVRILAL